MVGILLLSSQAAGLLHALGLLVDVVVQVGSCKVRLVSRSRLA